MVVALDLEISEEQGLNVLYMVVEMVVCKGPSGMDREVTAKGNKCKGRVGCGCGVAVRL